MVDEKAKVNEKPEEGVKCDVGAVTPEDLENPAVRKAKEAVEKERAIPEAERERAAMLNADPKMANTLAAELALRRYVRRDGGFRMGIPPKDKATAKRLMKLLKRDKPEYDTSLIP